MRRILTFGRISLYGVVSPREWVGKIILRFRKCGSANEKVQWFAIEASKVLEFGDIYSPFPAFTLEMNEFGRDSLSIRELL
jgi:hypothetical protein